MPRYDNEHETQEGKCDKASAETPYVPIRVAHGFARKLRKERVRKSRAADQDHAEYGDTNHDNQRKPSFERDQAQRVAAARLRRAGRCLSVSWSRLVGNDDRRVDGMTALSVTRPRGIKQHRIHYLRTEGGNGPPRQQPVTRAMVRRDPAGSAR